jgi:Ca-activated chloride channel family protein
MSFQSPWLLLALPLLGVAIGLWLLAERRRMRYAVKFTNVEVLATVVSGRSWLRVVPPALFALALASLLVALARPQVERTFLEERATVVLVMDTSRSMQAEDVPPTRLAAAQEAARTFLDQVPDKLRVGLVVFAGEAQVATPPTRDHDLVRTAVDEIDSFLVFGGTAIGDALQTAVELGKQVEESEPPQGKEIVYRQPSTQTRTLAQAADEEEEEQGPVSILFLSDGAQTRGTLLPEEGAARAKEAGIPVYTVALGTPQGVIRGFGPGGGGGGGGGGAPPFGFGGNEVIPVPPDPVTLNAIARTTGGRFTEARTAGELEKTYENLGSKLGQEPGKSEITFLVLALAGALVVAASVLSALWSPRLP